VDKADSVGLAKGGAVARGRLGKGGSGDGLQEVLGVEKGDRLKTPPAPKASSLAVRYFLMLA